MASLELNILMRVLEFRIVTTEDVRTKFVYVPELP